MTASTAKVRMLSRRFGHGHFKYLVLPQTRSMIITHKTGGKFTSKWEGPYVIYEVYTNGAYKIVDGERFQFWPNQRQVLEVLLPLEDKCLNMLPNTSLNCSSLKKKSHTKKTLLVHKSINCEWQKKITNTPGSQEYKL